MERRQRWRYVGSVNFLARLLVFAAIVGTLVRAEVHAVVADAAPCGGEPLIAAVVAGIFGGDAGGGDVNEDARASAADLIAAGQFGDAPPCPAGSARLALNVANHTGKQVARVTLTGRRLRCDCAADEQSTSFHETFECLGTAARPCGEIGGLAPGQWLVSLRVDEPATGQVQYRRELLVAGSEPQVSAWTAFATVLTVDRPGNTGIGSLRNRIQLARNEAKPLLIRFDDEVFPAGEATVIPLTFQLTTLDSDDVTIDATDALGLTGNRVVDAQGAPFGAFSVSGARNHLIGLRLRGVGGEDRDVVRVAGANADGNVLEQLIVDSTASGDGIGIDDGAGNDFMETATVVRDCEVRAAGDKGIKVTTGAFARIERSWVHDNLNGGVQATLGGHVLAIDNLVERNAGIGGENGFAVQGLEEGDTLSTMTLAGNLVRDNGGNGLSVRAFAAAVVADTAFVGNGTGGVRVFNDVGGPALAVIEGSALACNALDGIVVADDSLADLGGGRFASAGDNAFAFNGGAGIGFDLRNTSTQEVAAVWSQWTSCGAGVSCDEERVQRTDVRDLGGGTRISPAVAATGLGAPAVTAVSPGRGRAGELLRIFGAGFDAVAGYGDANCGSVAAANGCAPVRGNCVLIDGVPAAIEAVTPTMLVVRWPFTCLEPVPLRVAVARADGPATSDAMTVCSGAASARE